MDIAQRRQAMRQKLLHRRRAGVHGGPAGRLRHGERLCRGVPAGDRVDPRRVLRGRRRQPV